MLPFLALLAASTSATSGTASAQSLSIGPNGISMSTGNTANDLKLKLDQNGLKITTSAPQTPQNRVLNCAGRAVSIRGNSQTVTLTGRCPQVSISGSGNTVRVAQVGKINVSGSRNTVYWTKGLTTAKPSLSVVGANNRVTATNPAPAFRPNSPAVPKPRTAQPL